MRLPWYTDGGDNELDSGDTYHLIYHLYNWLNCRDLLSTLHEDLFVDVEEREWLIKEGDEEDKSGALDVLDRLKSRLRAGMVPPNGT